MKIRFSVFLIVCLIGILICFFFYPKSYFSCLDVEFSSTSIPDVKLKIEEKEYLVNLDLGSKTPLVLKKESLANHKKKQNEEIKWRDFKGNRYSANSFILPKIELGGFDFHSVIVRESNIEFSKNTRYLGKINTCKESVGRPIFEKFKVLLNFKNNRIFISNDIKKLKDLGFDIASFIKIPCKMSRAGLVIEFETDLGKKRLVIDTGATFTVLRKPSKITNIEEKLGLPIYRSKKFKTKNIDFGPWDLFLLDISPELHEIDGVLGMDFLKYHTMYIDFPNRAAYISRE